MIDFKFIPVKSLQKLNESLTISTYDENITTLNLHKRRQIPISFSSAIKFLHYINENQKSLYDASRKDKEVKELIFNESFSTAFQPILSLAEGGTIGFEVLNRPKSSVHFPTTEDFYNYIGKSNNVFKIEGFLRNLSLKRYAEQVRQTDSHEDGLIFLNIQPQVLTDSAYRSGTTLDLLAKYGLSPDRVVLELTEKEAVSDYQSFEKIIDNYRKQGFRIAIDDAGTGYNSLKTIISLKPEFIKLDKFLIRDIHIQPAQQQLVELLLGFAEQSNTHMIAEGIENVQELQYLKDLGVHFGQGYALGRPQAVLKRGGI